MGFLSVRSAWSNVLGNVAPLLRPPFSSSCVRISHATPVESAEACVDECAGFQWCATPHLTLNRGNNRGRNTEVDRHRHRSEDRHRHKAWEHSIHTDRAQYSIR